MTTPVIQMLRRILPWWMVLVLVFSVIHSSAQSAEAGVRDAMAVQAARQKSIEQFGQKKYYDAQHFDLADLPPYMPERKVAGSGPLGIPNWRAGLRATSAPGANSASAASGTTRLSMCTAMVCVIFSRRASPMTCSKAATNGTRVCNST